MPSIFGHGITGISVSYLSQDQFPRLAFFKLTLLSFIAADLPDIDVIFHHAGLDYIEALAHRNFCHSVFFALLAAPLMGFLCYPQESLKQRRMLSIYFFALIMSHNLLDALTLGVGVGFFYPLIKTQMNLPWTPLRPAGFTLMEYKMAVIKEALIVWLPWIIICALRFTNKKARAF